jgi:hypothetical protein
MSTLTNLEKNNLLIIALINSFNPDDNLQSIASKLFEVMTGETLQSETDITNGEDFTYKSTSSCAVSNRVHQSVANWFGWSTNSIQSVNNDELKLVNLSNESEIVKILEEQFSDFQKPENAIEKITNKNKVILESADLYETFAKISGLYFEKCTSYYNKKAHMEFLETMNITDIDSQEVLFINHLGETVDYS